MKLSEIIELYPDKSCIMNARKEGLFLILEDDIKCIISILKKYNVQTDIKFNSNGLNGVNIIFDSVILKYNLNGIYSNNWGKHLDALQELLINFTSSSLSFNKEDDYYGYQYKKLLIEHPDAFERFEYGG